MKVTQEQTFKPVVITLETPEEVETLEYIMGFDVTITSTICDKDPTKLGEVRALMVGMYRGLTAL